MKISDRKSEHIRIVLEEDVRFRAKSSGFEAYDLIHCALPEMDLEEVDPSTAFLGKRLSFPLMISAMTGGFEGAEAINGQLSQAAAEASVAMAVGSQRQILESNAHLESYRIVRRNMPDGVVVGNVGAEEVAGLEDPSPILRMIDLIEANAVAVHLNPLQEALQPEGSARFSGVLKGIEDLVRSLPVPVMVKEVGCGISFSVAEQLAGVGVKYIDVAGAGGASWAGIESFRTGDDRLAKKFWDWGIPTAESIMQVRRVKGVHVIASGGIGDGIALAKALALGAALGGAAAPFFRAVTDGGTELLVNELMQWKAEFRLAMFLTGSRAVDELHHDGLIQKV